MFEWYPHYEELFAQVQLVFFMLGMGLTLSLADFFQVVQKPRSLLVAGFGQIVVLPLVAYGLTRLTRLEAGLAVGLILVAAMPGGNQSKVFTFLGRGNVALSITLSVVTTLLALVTVPLQLRWLALEFVPESFTVPVGYIVRQLALFLLLPIVVGLVLARTLPRARRLMLRICINLGFLFVFVMILGSLGSGRIHPMEYGWKVPLTIIAFGLLSQQLNMLPFRLLGWPRGDRLAAGIEVTMRNINLALLLKPILFPPTEPLGDAVLFVILFYAGVGMAAGLPLALNHRRLSRREFASETPG